MLMYHLFSRNYFKATRCANTNFSIRCIFSCASSQVQMKRSCVTRKCLPSWYTAIHITDKKLKVLRDGHIQHINPQRMENLINTIITIHVSKILPFSSCERYIEIILPKEDLGFFIETTVRPIESCIQQDVHKFLTEFEFAFNPSKDETIVAVFYATSYF